RACHGLAGALDRAGNPRPTPSRPWSDHGRCPRLGHSIMAQVKNSGLNKKFSGDIPAVRGVDLEIADGELTVLVGPSGCGKSTLLRTIAGLEDMSEGRIEIGGGVVNDMRPKDRDVAMVFQDYALYPHMTVAKNIGFGLRARKF